MFSIMRTEKFWTDATLKFSRTRQKQNENWSLKIIWWILKEEPCLLELVPDLLRSASFLSAFIAPWWCYTKYNRLLPVKERKKLFYLCFMKPFCEVFWAPSSAPLFSHSSENLPISGTDPVRCSRLPVASVCWEVPKNRKRRLRDTFRKCSSGHSEMTHRSKLRRRKMENARLMAEYLDTILTFASQSRVLPQHNDFVR